MSEEALGRLITSARTLIAATDGSDPHAMDDAVANFGSALADVRAIHGWRELPGVARRVLHAIELVEQARVHTNYQADRNRRRLETLAAAAGVTRPSGYNRYGRAA